MWRHLSSSGDSGRSQDQIKHSNSSVLKAPGHCVIPVVQPKYAYQPKPFFLRSTTGCSVEGHRYSHGGVAGILIRIHPGEVMKKTGCNKSTAIFRKLSNIYKVIEINLVLQYREVSKLTKEKRKHESTQLKTWTMHIHKNESYIVHHAIFTFCLFTVTIGTNPVMESIEIAHIFHEKVCTIFKFVNGCSTLYLVNTCNCSTNKSFIKNEKKWVE